jgi:putative transposase
MEKYLLQVADIYCYCLLKNHFHLLLQIKEPELIGEKYRNKPFLPFSHFFNAYCKGINKAYNRTGSLFQEHFHRNRVEDEKYFIQLIAYIHLNPVKHKFVDNFKEYPYSSYLAYKSNSKTIISKDFVLNFFDTPEEFDNWHDLNKIRYEGIVGEIENLDY